MLVVEGLQHLSDSPGRAFLVMQPRHDDFDADAF